MIIWNYLNKELTIVEILNDLNTKNIEELIIIREEEVKK